MSKKLTEMTVRCAFQTPGIDVFACFIDTMDDGVPQGNMAHAVESSDCLRKLTDCVGTGGGNDTQYARWLHDSPVVDEARLYS